MMVGDNSADDLATVLAISPRAIEEAVRRGLLRFVKHRNSPCWHFGDSRNGSFRRIDGKPFRINGEYVKAEAETKGQAWHRLIGLNDVVANDRHQILLTPEGTKDALAAFHFADAEDTLAEIGVVVALGSAIKLTQEDLERFPGRRVRIPADADRDAEQASMRIAQQLAAFSDEVQLFNLRGLNRDDDTPVKDLFDVTRIDYNDFEANRDLWSITNLETKGERVKTIPTRICFSDFSNIIRSKQAFLPSPPSPPHVSPESHGFPVYPVSNSQELEKELEELAKCNACTERDTARERRWQLVRDLNAVEKRIARKLNPDEAMRTFDNWYGLSQPYLDSKKTRDEYLAKFFAELGKVRVPTGEGEALKKALEHVWTLSVFELPGLPGIAHAPESWRRLAALHRELARQSANGTYFLGCRDAAKASPGLIHQTAYKHQSRPRPGRCD